MSDHRLRALERRWRETGGADDEAALLLERVRLGRLRRERLELAARWGHEGARVATGLGQAPPSDLEGTLAWLPPQDLLTEWAVRAAVEATRVAISRTVVPRTRGRLSGLLRKAGKAVEHVERWLDCPCPGHAPSGIENSAAFLTTVDLDLDRMEGADLGAALGALMPMSGTLHSEHFTGIWQVERLVRAHHAWTRECRAVEPSNVAEVLGSVIAREALA